MSAHDSAAPHREAEASGAREWDDDRPMCRDCADNDGTCPHDGTPCDPALPAPTPPEADRALREAAEAFTADDEAVVHVANLSARRAGAVVEADALVRVILRIQALRAALAPRPTPEDRTDG